MERYNNSHAGNGCYINEYWYQLDDPDKTIIRVRKVQGWAEDKSVHSFDEPPFDAPDAVLGWFGESS